MEIKLYTCANGIGLLNNGCQFGAWTNASKSYEETDRNIEISVDDRDIEKQKNEYGAYHVLRLDSVEVVGDSIKRLPLETWKNIFRNLKDMDEEDYYDGEIDWVEVIWLDGTDEWCLCYGEEMFEDGFKSEREAQKRLHYLENKLL